MEFKSQLVTSTRLSIATPDSRALCCRRALRNVSGWKKSSRVTGLESSAPLWHRSHSAFTASILATTALQYPTGSSGPSQSLSHEPGTAPCIKRAPAANDFGVSGVWPPSVLPSAASVSSTSSKRRWPRARSSSTNASTGDNCVPEICACAGRCRSRSPGFPSIKRSHARRSGARATDHATRSNPSAVPAAVAIKRSDAMTCSLWRIWTVRSTFTGRENSEGEFPSSSVRKSATKSRWFAVCGNCASVPGSDRTRTPPPPVISPLKNWRRYVRNTTMSYALSTRPP
mmetsp:Transcript_12898/g.42705  ORF Transcript_12898/g.42705 Transcript_12898/m.42705 type:complete len:286 (-) Transcript_12898:1733-2590(-)